MSISENWASFVGDLKASPLDKTETIASLAMWAMWQIPGLVGRTIIWYLGALLLSRWILPDYFHIARSDGEEHLLTLLLVGWIVFEYSGKLAEFGKTLQAGGQAGVK